MQCPVCKESIYWEVPQDELKKVKAELKKRRLLISNGYGKLREKTFRIAHMGDRTIIELKELLDAIDEILVET